ncbi:MAG: hypothetical protein QOC58_2099 [Mycobacterium sp.]|jgi:hypothetical protein|nr:hypothetical protein [Mycobacterium sp.]
MSYVIASPEYVAAAATDLANIASALGDANSAALGPTSSVPAAGADEVSAVIAALFDAHSQVYQALSAQAAAFHAQFVQLMNSGAAQYALAEAANANPLQTTEPGLMSQAGTAGQALTPAQPLVGLATAPASMAASVPAAAAGLTGGTAHPVPAAAISPAAAVPPVSVASSGLTPIGGAPLASAALGSAGAPAAPLQPSSPAFVAPTGEPAAPLPGPVTATVTAPPVETPEIGPATTATPLPATPLTAAPQSAPAYRPATGAYSPGAAEEQSAAAPA